MKKNKVIALCLTVLLVFSVYTPVTAAESSEQKLSDMGLLLNISDAELDAILSREIGLTMILKAIGYTQADADEVADNGYFTDVDGWSKGWAELAYLNGITSGVGDNKFDPYANLTERQYVAFLLRALEYGTSESWDNSVVLGREAGLIDVTNDLSSSSYTKRIAADVMFNSLSSSLQVTGITLIEKLVANNVVESNKAETYGLISSDFQVSSVIADNLKVIKLSFSDAIDEETLTGDLIKVYKNSTQLSFDSDVKDGVSAQKYAFDVIDSRTLNIIFGSGCLQSDIIRIEIDGFKSEEGQIITGYKRDIKLTDITEPYIEEVIGVNQKMIKVKYNEPVQYKIGSRLFDDVFINDLRLAGTASLSYDKKVLTFTLNDTLADGTYVLNIEGTTDYAGLVGDDEVRSFTIVTDNLAPYVESAKAPNRNEVVVTFSEDIDNSKGYVKINNITYNLTDTNKVTVNENKAYIELDSSLSSSDAFAPVTGYFKNIEDIIGNKVAIETAFTFMADFDSTLPTLSASVNTSNQIIVTFSEPVQAFTSLNYVVTDSEDNLVPSSVYASGTTSTVFKIVLGDPLIDKATYKLIVKGVKDLSVMQNSLAETEVDLQMFDKKQPTVLDIKLIDVETVRISFSEAMDLSDISDASMYLYDDVSEGTKLPLSSISSYSMTVDTDRKYVDIYVDELSTSDKFTISNVKDESGSVLQNYNTQWSITVPSPFVTSDVEARLIDGRTIELIATGHNFSEVNANDFVVRTASGDSQYHYVYKAVFNSSDTTKVTLILNDDLGTDAKYLTKSQYLYTRSDVTTKDTYNQKLTISYNSPLKIEDYVVPTVSVNLETTDTLVLEFSEVVNADSSAEVLDDILLRDANGNYVALSSPGNLTYSGGTSDFNNFNVLTISGLTGGEEYTLQVLSRNIEDAEGNLLEKYDSTAFTVSE